jgi:DNA-binding transcriptional MerR regulator|tara:strand:- start:3287 stop:3490 length:204 start_codon:yes stop_codon:yes gene_type:complete
MTFDELPWLLRPIEVERLSGIETRKLAQLGKNGSLEVVRIKPNGYRYYTKESVKKFLKIEGNPQVNT